MSKVINEELLVKDVAEGLVLVSNGFIKKSRALELAKANLMFIREEMLEAQDVVIQELVYKEKKRVEGWME